jgi:DNA-binding GntR family transcriptional regulator
MSYASVDDLESVATAVEPVARSGETVERTANLLKQQILDGRLVPGQRLISRDLIEELGISRGPLREAFRRLAADGLVDLVPNRGAIVRRLAVHEIAHIYQVREALEGYAARVAAARIGEGDNRERLLAVLEQGRRHLARPNFQEFVVDNRLFHHTIVQMSENPELSALIDKYQAPVFMIQLRQLIGVDQMIRNSLAEHEAIAAGILNGDPDAASEAMRRHLWHSADALVKIPSLKS